MSIRKTEFVLGEYYHIYNRGNSKQEIFLDDQDRERFLKLLYLCNSNKNINFRDDIVDRKIDAWDFDRGDNIVSIGAWVLMSNHFHILITIPPSPMSSVGEDKKKENEISFFMRKLCTSYVKYFNKKYKRTGGLFGGNFKSNLVNTDEYLKYMFSYIHLNPIKTIEPGWKKDGIKNIQRSVDFLKKYKWSSYQDYCEVNRIEGKILSRESFPGYFTDVEILKKEIFEWLLFSPTLDIGEIKEK